MAMSKALYEAQKRYKKKYVKHVMLSLNKRTDTDIIKKLDSLENKQGYIKKLIRKDIEETEDHSMNDQDTDCSESMNFFL
ncbi:MAG: hypothetical protein LIV24_09415 [Eubacterium sp.]|uniref:Uncharacterized protein n=1 Tax=Candidatus Weimeria bifida TaxID=2599074 RepID=A0A6N7IXE8_9FIRM|nr:hypothetical protein [Eubacterium sp.]MQN00670.1 hypothetical protein [Candidatus Weimeria bifida]RRF94546.1 MAG: hypothetical protein DUD27_09345 [Lachnospiraceae bacterium]